MVSRITAVVDAPAERVFGYLSKIENLPEWATEFARELRVEDGRPRSSTVSASSTSHRGRRGHGRDRHVRRSRRRRSSRCSPRASSLAGRNERVHVHDVPGARGCRRAVRVAVRVAAARVREHRAPLRVTAAREAEAKATRANLGFLLAKASQRWNEFLRERFVRGPATPRSALVRLAARPALRGGRAANGQARRRAWLSKQTMTTMVRLLERDGLVSRSPTRPTGGRPGSP